MTVAISGLGVVTPFGIGASRFFGAAMERRGPAPFEIEEVKRELHGQRLRNLNGETIMLLLAVRTALVDSCVTSPIDPAGLGVAVATRHAGLQEYAALYWRGARAGQRVNPTLGPQTGFNAPAAHVSIGLRAEGPNATFPGGPVAGFEALSWAVDAIEGEGATAMLTCGVDMLPAAVATRTTGADVGGGPRPFDFRRSGPAPGAAAVAILLEDQRRLCERGRPQGATIASVATAFSAGGGLMEAGSRALEDAAGRTPWSPSSFGGCLAGANGSVEGDACEAFALHETLGRDIPVAAIKGSSGEADGAASLLQVVVAALSLRQGAFPPTAGLVRLDSALPPLAVSSHPLAIDIELPLMVHSFDPQDAAGAAVIRAGKAGP